MVHDTKDPWYEESMVQIVYGTNGPWYKWSTRGTYSPWYE